MATLSYSADATITIAPEGLASSASFVAGVESNEIDNTTNVYQDVMVYGRITVGTTPTINTQINIYVWGSNVSLATTAIDTLDGTSSAETLTNTGILASAFVAARSVQVLATTSDITYPIRPFSVASYFEGNMPKFWGLFIAHNTGVNLNATAGNHVFKYVGIKY